MIDQNSRADKLRAKAHQNAQKSFQVVNPEKKKLFEHTALVCGALAALWERLEVPEYLAGITEATQVMVLLQHGRDDYDRLSSEDSVRLHRAGIYATEYEAAWDLVHRWVQGPEPAPSEPFMEGIDIPPEIKEELVDEEISRMMVTFTGDNFLSDPAPEPTSDPAPEITIQSPLLPECSPEPPTTLMLPLGFVVDQVEHIPDPPKSFVDSLRVVQLQSIVVRKDGPTFKLVAGRRRVRGFKVIADQDHAGNYWNTLIRADVFDGNAWSHDQVMALQENSYRSNNPVEELRQIEELTQQGYSEQEIAEATGMRVQTVRKRLQMAQLTPELRSGLEAGKIAPGVALRASRLPRALQDKLGETLESENTVTGETVRAVRRVQIQEAVAMFPDEPEDTADIQTPDSALTDLQIRSMIESVRMGGLSPANWLQQALNELLIWRQLYGRNEHHGTNTDADSAGTPS